MADGPSRNLKILLAGCGKIFRKHVEAIRNTPRLAAVGVCGRRPDRAAAAAGRFDLPWFVDLATALDRTRPDAVSVLTPSGNHAAVGIAAARRKIHVFVEKPVCLRLTDAETLIRACAEAGVSLFVVKQCRYHPSVRRVRRALATGQFGRMVLATVRLRWCRRQNYYDGEDWRGTWSMDGGVLANHASHSIDLLRQFAGPVESVFASAATRLARIETEDTAVATIRFESGAVGLIEATTAARPSDLEGSISILGERGSAVLGGLTADRIDHWAFDPPLAEDASPPEFPSGHAGFYREVADVLLDGRTPGDSLVTGEEGLETLKIIHALYESIETGKPAYPGNHAGCRLCGQGGSSVKA